MAILATSRSEGRTRDEVGGGLTLRDGTGHELLHIGIEPGGLGGPVAYVRMKSGVTRAEALSLDGTGSIEVGGGSVGGRITVKQGDGLEAIRINARERLIALGGGNACETWQEWIRIDGNVPSIRLRYVNPIGIEQPPMTP